MKLEHHTPPAGERLDPNRLAALIDGRLSTRDRDAALARIAESPDDMEVMADVLAVAAELDGDVIDIRSRAPGRGRAPRSHYIRWLVAAAVVLAVALPVMMRRGASPSGIAYATLLSSRTPLAPGWDTPDWSATRGSSDAIKERARAVRVGAVTSAIDIAIARHDSATPPLARQAAALLVDVPGASDVVTTYRTMAASGAPVAPEEARRARDRARSMVTTWAFDEGAWLEAARIAAVDRDSAFFRSSESLAQLRELEQQADARTQADVFAVRRLIGQGDWEALEDKTTNILALLAAP
ncbi:MAG: hypothetical protein ACREPM_11970 [Gemmatimonadaceae bacterium]